MKISGINGTNTQVVQMDMNQSTDSYSRNIQDQIVNAQMQLQKLSSDEDMTVEEKMKKRQEIQQQISDLNTRLRQHQMEQRREKQQEKGTSMDDMLGGDRSAKTDGEYVGLSQTSMTAMISADTAIRQVRVQSSVATRMEGRAGVLESEIRLDGARGQDTTKKREELADAEQAATKATASQMGILGDANQEMTDAAKTDREDARTSGAAEENAKRGRQTAAYIRAVKSFDVII